MWAPRLNHLDGEIIDNAVDGVPGRILQQCGRILLMVPTTSVITGRGIPVGLQKGQAISSQNRKYQPPFMQAVKFDNTLIRPAEETLRWVPYNVVLSA